MTHDAGSIGAEPAGDPQPDPPVAPEPDVARDGLIGGHWHTVEGFRDCPDHCMPPAWIEELAANLAIQRAGAGRNMHMLHSHGRPGPPCHCTGELGRIVGSLFGPVHAGPCAQCDEGRASPSGKHREAWSLWEQRETASRVRRRARGALTACACWPTLVEDPFAPGLGPHWLSEHPDRLRYLYRTRLWAVTPHAGWQCPIHHRVIRKTIPHKRYNGCPVCEEAESYL
jgi:hypothetical protein